MENETPLYRQWSVLGFLLLISLSAFYGFYYFTNILIKQFISSPSVFSYNSGYYSLFGVGLGILTVISAAVLKTIYKIKSSHKVLNILSKVLYISLASVFVLPITAKLFIPNYLESIQYRYCDVPYYGSMYPPTVYTNSLKSCLTLLKKECAKPGRIFKPCIITGMSAYIKIKKD